MASAAATAEDVLLLLNSLAYSEVQAVREARVVVVALCRHFYNLRLVTGSGGKVHYDAVPKPHQLTGVQKERMVLEEMYAMSVSGVVLSAPSPKPYTQKPPQVHWPLREALWTLEET